MIANPTLKSSGPVRLSSSVPARIQSRSARARVAVARAAFGADYDELKRAAVRSQLAYQDPDAVSALWKTARNPLIPLALFKPEDISSAQAERYTAELKALEQAPIFITSPPHDKFEDAQAYAWTQGDTLFVTFRGTHGFRDIIADVEVHDTAVELNGDVRVHEGFYEQLLSIRRQISGLIDGNDDIKSIHFSGHSLGGAIAQIAAAMFADKHPSKTVTCQTFGGPRCGNKAFVEWFEEVVAEHVRVTNKNDPVPMVPQRSVWEHTSQCICIDDEVIAKAENADVPWFMRWLTTAQNIDLKGITADHAIELYINRLQLLSELPMTAPATSIDNSRMTVPGASAQSA